MDKLIWDKYFSLVEEIKQSIMDRCPFEEFSIGEFYMLRLLMDYEKRNVNVTTKLISEYLRISKPAVSQMLNALEKKELIERTINKEDRRQICITTTRKGRDLVIEQCKKHEELFSEIIKSVDEKDIETLFVILENVLKAVKEV
ncbi:MAG: MarR family transcriptional regulator [Clostridia bacterium]|nr:MarR family transcriptional regulator [Clostridia bacterium]